MNIERLFLIFIIYAVIGYITEVIDIYIKTKKLTFARGFLVGPYIPIYGLGAVLMGGFLSVFKNNIFLVFLFSMLICTLLEYVVSYTMEKLFKLRWWDYSKEKYNLNGRVCLKNTLLFGFAGVILCEAVYPFISSLILSIPEFYVKIFSVLLAIIFFSDVIISNLVVSKLNKNAKRYINKDATIEVKEEIIKEIEKHIHLNARIVQSFPNLFEPDNTFRELNEMIVNTKKEIKNATKNVKKNLKIKKHNK